MSVDDKTLERKLLIKRIFPPSTVYAVGKDLSIPYFDRYVNAWEPDQDEAALELAQFVNDKQLLSALKKHPPRSYAVFRGANYTFEDNALLLKGSNQRIQAGIRETEKKFGKVVAEVLKAMVEAGGSFGKDEYAAIAKLKVNLEAVMARLEQLKVVVPSYVSEDYREWRMLEETLPFIREELGLPTLEHKPVVQTQLPTASGGVKDGQPQKDPDEPPDPLEDERKKIVEMQNELDTYLADLLKNRLQQTIKFGKTFSAGVLADYLQGLFGEMLYADSFLSIIQQYSLCDVEVINDAGKAGLKTGWSYALFGEPGTGKSFSTRDLILGIPGGRMQAHGVPGRNRYCGGITPARFIRIGQLYVGKTYNFIVPEFNDWFRYSGMVDTLKIAMERGEIKQELHREVIGPYRFDSFFTVNYNTQVMGQGYAVTIGDPNFAAIEDRMICRLHRMTKDRYLEIAQNQAKLALGQIDIAKGAQQIRDHVTLVYAIQTGHPLVKGRFAKKPVKITPQMYDGIGKARTAILKHLPEGMKFSARLEHNVVKFACSASLLNYFNSDLEYIPVSADALERAIHLYVEGASVRSREAFKPEDVMKDLAKKKIS